MILFKKYKEILKNLFIKLFKTKYKHMAINQKCYPLFKYPLF